MVPSFSDTKNKRHESKNVALVGLTGLAAGVLVGLLIAPDKGSETRRKIMKGKESLVDDLKYGFYELMGQFVKKAKEEKKDLDKV